VNERDAFIQWLAEHDYRRLVFLDETGAKTNMTRAYGRARKGERLKDYVPNGHWNTTTLVAALTWEAAIAPMILDGPMDTVAFESYICQVLIPELPEGAIVVMDNLSAHKAPSIERLIEDAGFQLKYLPPYSPDLNPIEMMWSKVKNKLRESKARTQEGLCQAIATALAEITPQDAKGYFQHSIVAIIS
jgi:transposase